MALKVLSEKVLEDVLTQWKEAKENSEATTGNAFVEMVIEAFLNPKIKTVEVTRPTDEQAAEVLTLNNEISKLKTFITLKDEKIEAQEEALRNLTDQVAAIVEPVPTVQQLQPNQEIITFDKPLVLAVLDIERDLAAKQAKKEVSRSQHLIDTFWMGIDKGTSYPYHTWVDGELRKLNKQLQTPIQ